MRTAGILQPTRTVRIHLCEGDDCAAVAAIYGEAVLHGTATFEIEPPDAGEMARRYGKLVDGGYPFLVATAGAAVAGFAYAGPYGSRAAFRYTVEDSIYVAPEYQGRGIGRLLLDALVAAATARGYRQMVAVIGDSANHPSIHLHGRLGFTHAGILPAVGWKAGRWLDVVLMQRALGEGGGTAPA